MANLFLTIEEHMGIYGPLPTNKWGANNWNAFAWSEGSPLELTQQIEKVISNTITPADTVRFDGQIVLGGEVVTLGASFDSALGRSLEESLSISDSIIDMILQDGNGYIYNFPDRASDGADRDFPTWTQGTGNAPTWSQPSSPSTTWSDG